MVIMSVNLHHLWQAPTVASSCHCSVGLHLVMNLLPSFAHPQAPAPGQVELENPPSLNPCLMADR